MDKEKKNIIAMSNDYVAFEDYGKIVTMEFDAYFRSYS